MLLDRYAPYFFNSNFREAGSDAGWEGYRGELIVIEGESPMTRAVASRRSPSSSRPPSSLRATS